MSVGGAQRDITHPPVRVPISAGPAPSPLFADSSVPVPEPLPDFDEFAAPRTEREILISIANLLEENLAVQRKILAALGSSSDSKSSVEIDSNGSAGKVKVKVKRYVDSPVDEARAAATAEFAQLMSDIELGQQAGWAALVAPAAVEGTP